MTLKVSEFERLRDFSTEFTNTALWRNWDRMFVVTPDSLLLRLRVVCMTRTFLTEFLMWCWKNINNKDRIRVNLHRSISWIWLNLVMCTLGINDETYKPSKKSYQCRVLHLADVWMMRWKKDFSRRKRLSPKWQPNYMPSVFGSRSSMFPLTSREERNREKYNDYKTEEGKKKSFSI